MRQEHVSYARVGTLELRLDPVPPPQSATANPDPPPAPVDDLRASLDDLLHSSGVDPEPFLHAMRKSA